MRLEELKAVGKPIDKKDVRFLNKEWIVRGQKISPKRIRFTGGEFYLLPQGVT